jgi:hypothetical protein
MSKLGLLSAGLTAIAMVAGPTMAREHHVASRHVAVDQYTVGMRMPARRAARLPAFRRGALGHLPRRPGPTNLLANRRRDIDPARAAR